MKVHLIAGDLTTFAGGAICNAANEVMLGGGGVDGAIHRAAGPELRKACEAVYAEDVLAYGPGLREMRGKRCGIGQVVPTPAFNLPCKWVFHTVGPVWPVGCEEDEDPLSRSTQPDDDGKPFLTKGRHARLQLAACYGRSLYLASAMGLKSIAFPAISTGVYGCPQEVCAEVAASVCGGRHMQFLGAEKLRLEVTFFIHPAEHLSTWQEAAKYKAGD